MVPTDEDPVQRIPRRGEEERLIEAMSLLVDELEDEDALDEVWVTAEVDEQGEMLQLVVEGKQKQKAKAKKTYKRVANRVVPVSTTLPEAYKPERREPEGILNDMSKILLDPPPFIPGKRYSEEQRGEFPINPKGFLTPHKLRIAEWTHTIV